ncbi:MAG: hypothetical protein M1824_002491 [Vezdaea acicularis]|nr:MAG: hypothetical protein M1824_002491 [Vezdaea acicularis]
MATGTAEDDPNNDPFSSDIQPSITTPKSFSERSGRTSKEVKGPHVYTMAHRSTQSTALDHHETTSEFKDSRSQPSNLPVDQESPSFIEHIQRSISVTTRSSANEDIVAGSELSIHSVGNTPQSPRRHRPTQSSGWSNGIRRHSQRVQKISARLGHVSRSRNSLRLKRAQLRETRDEASSIEAEFVKAAQIFYSTYWISRVSLDADTKYKELLDLYERVVAAKDLYGALEATYNDLEDRLDLEEYDLQVLEDNHVNKYKERKSRESGSNGSASVLHSLASASSHNDDYESRNDLSSKSGVFVRFMTESSSDAMESYISELSKASAISGEIQELRRNQTVSKQGDRLSDVNGGFTRVDSSNTDIYSEKVHENLMKLEVVEQEAARLRREAVMDDDSSSDDGSLFELNTANLEPHRNPLLFPLSDNDANHQIIARAEGALLVRFSSPRDRVNRWLLHILRSTLMGVWLYQSFIFSYMANAGLPSLLLEDESALATKVFMNWLTDDSSQDSDLSGPETEHIEPTASNLDLFTRSVDGNHPVLYNHHSDSHERPLESSSIPLRLFDPRNRPRSLSEPIFFHRPLNAADPKLDTAWRLTYQWVLNREQGRPWIQSAAICCLIDDLFV